MKITEQTTCSKNNKEILLGDWRDGNIFMLKIYMGNT